jgi:hypothetical protein
MFISFGLTRDWKVRNITPIFNEFYDFTYTKRFFENREYGISELHFEIYVYEEYEKKEKILFYRKQSRIQVSIHLNYNQFISGDIIMNIEQLLNSLQISFEKIKKRKIVGFDIEKLQKDFFLYLVARKLIDPEINPSW